MVSYVNLRNLLTLIPFIGAVAASQGHRKTCVVKHGGSVNHDDAPAIIDAFKTCGQHGRVVFSPTTYYVNSILNINWLEDVEIDVQGELLVRGPSETTTYRESSMLIYQ